MWTPGAGELLALERRQQTLSAVLVEWPREAGPMMSSELFIRSPCLLSSRKCLEKWDVLTRWRISRVISKSLSTPGNKNKSRLLGAWKKSSNCRKLVRRTELNIQQERHTEKTVMQEEIPLSLKRSMINMKNIQKKNARKNKKKRKVHIIWPHLPTKS